MHVADYLNRCAAVKSNLGLDTYIYQSISAAKEILPEKGVLFIG